MSHPTTCLGCARYRNGWGLQAKQAGLSRTRERMEVGRDLATRHQNCSGHQPVVRVPHGK